MRLSRSPGPGGLRVLHLIDSLAPAGAEQSLAAMVPHLVAGGVEVHVAYLVERDGLRVELERAGASVASLAGGAPGRRAWLDRATAHVGDVLPDVVHTTLFEADLAGRRAAARNRVPCVSSLVNSTYGWDQARRDGVGRLRLRAAQAADIATARRVARFHAVTDDVARAMSRRLLVPRHRIEVIPRGRDPQVLGRRDADRRARVRRALGVEDGTPVVLAVGRQEPQKGLDVLLRAVPLVRARHPGIRVLVAGREGRATPALGELMGRLDLGEAASLLGLRNDVPDLLAAADVFAFPSRWEGAGGTVLEAMALECPIVMSRLPTLREAADEEVAVMVPPDRPDDLARAIVGVLDHPEAAARRARVGRARFEERFSVQSTTARMVDLYRRVAASSPRGRHGGEQRCAAADRS